MYKQAFFLIRVFDCLDTLLILGFIVLVILTNFFFGTDPEKLFRVSFTLDEMYRTADCLFAISGFVS